MRLEGHKLTLRGKARSSRNRPLNNLHWQYRAHTFWRIGNELLWHFLLRWEHTRCSVPLGMLHNHGRLHIGLSQALALRFRRSAWLPLESSTTRLGHAVKLRGLHPRPPPTG